ncbi:hypothetical protein ES703_70448 [subsurface metagenome]
MAVNCWVRPSVIDGADGVTSIDTSTGSTGIVTVRVTPGLVIPSSKAVITAMPTPIPVASPVSSMVATLMLELVQVTKLVISAVELSE